MNALCRSFRHKGRKRRDAFEMGIQMPEAAGVFDGRGGDQEVCGGNRVALSLKSKPPPRRLLDDRRVDLKPWEGCHVIPEQRVRGLGLGALDDLDDDESGGDHRVFGQCLADRSPEGLRAAGTVVFDPHRAINEEPVRLHALSLGAEG